MFLKLSPMGVFAVEVICLCTSLQVFVLPACLQTHRLSHAFWSWYAQRLHFFENLNNPLQNFAYNFLIS